MGIIRTLLAFVFALIGVVVIFVAAVFACIGIVAAMLILCVALLFALVALLFFAVAFLLIFFSPYIQVLLIGGIVTAVILIRRKIKKIKNAVSEVFIEG